MASESDIPVAESAAAGEPRKPGRPKGLGRVPGSGRKPGSRNKVNADIKALILARGKPAELLCDVARGFKIRVGPQAGPAKPVFVYPTLEQRIEAAEILLKKVIPDLKGQELTGADGGPVSIEQTAPLSPSEAQTQWGVVFAGLARRRDLRTDLPVAADRAAEVAALLSVEDGDEV